MKNFIFILILSISIGLQAQENMNITGGIATGSNGELTYSVGCFYQTSTGSNGSIVDGIQQPFEILVITEIENLKGITLSMSVYSNPTTDYLILNVDNFELSNLTYQLFDINGSVIQSGYVSSKTNIAMSNFASSTYFIKVLQNGKEIKSFKIIKKY
ncbi:MAG: T9SS type A sorting domain-containing protein [Bacteroidales bacterium]|nr:T9SS type A sorting domain-containing protein [Bacteroidales bacterium]